jgi:hypothetical protein
MKRHVWPEQQPRYAYDVEFAPQLASYLVAGSSGDSGSVSLVSLTGHIVKTQRGFRQLRMRQSSITNRRFAKHGKPAGNRSCW